MSVSMYWLVVVMLTCPSHDLMTLSSTPDWSKMHGSRVAHGVRTDAFCREGRLVRGRSRNVSFEDRDDTEAGEPPVVSIQEEGRIRLVSIVALLEISPKCVHGRLPERTRPFLAPFAQNAPW